MADDTTNLGQQDRIRVNVHEEHEVRYWTERFGCTREELEAAVKQAGVMAIDVAKALKGILSPSLPREVWIQRFVTELGKRLPNLPLSSAYAEGVIEYEASYALAPEEAAAVFVAARLE